MLCYLLITLHRYIADIRERSFDRLQSVYTRFNSILICRPSLLHFWPPRCVQNRPPSTSMRRGIKHYKIGWEIVIKFGMWEQTYYHHYYYVGLGSGQVVILCLKAHSTETHAKPTTWLLRQFHCCCLWWWWRGSWMGPTSSTAAQYE